MKLIKAQESKEHLVWKRPNARNVVLDSRGKVQFSRNRSMFSLLQQFFFMLCVCVGSEERNSIRGALGALLLHPSRTLTHHLCTLGARLLSHPPKPSPAGYTFVGLVGLRDPPKPGVREAVEQCNSAGVQVVMVTGDHPLTAEAIARQVLYGTHYTRLDQTRLHWSVLCVTGRIGKNHDEDSS